MQFIIKKSLIILLFLSCLAFPQNSHSSTKFFEDYGIITLMNHRFEENKYPSTNIKVDDFKIHLNTIKSEELHFLHPKNFNQALKNEKNKRKVLLTIDDAFSSFYETAWPILKNRKIPFILFVSTREVGKNGYMTWDQIREIAKEEFVHIGNHSHSHDYLIDFDEEKIIKDINKSIEILKQEIGYNSNFFSYPFGEYSLTFRNIIKDFDFEYAFGQHSGVVDETKDLLALPRFPINEKYGEQKRFKTILNTLPLKYKKIEPREKYINSLSNPPKIVIEFFTDDNLNKINCYSNELNVWRKSELNFITNLILEIKLKGKFTTERGRVNCSIQEQDGFWRWLGMQFVVAEK